MEPVGVVPEIEWNAFNTGMYSTEEFDFMAQLLGSCLLPNEIAAGISSFGVPSSMFYAGHESAMNLAGIDQGIMYPSDNNANTDTTNLYSFSQGSSILFPTSSHDDQSNFQCQLSDHSHQVLAMNDSSSSMSIYFCTGEDRNTGSPVEAFTTGNLMEGDECLNREMSSGSGSANESGRNLPDPHEAVLHGKNLQMIRTEPKMAVPETSAEEKDNNNLQPENSKKRFRVSGDVRVQRKRNAKPKKNRKLVSPSNNDEDNNGGINRQASSSCCSEDENSNASQEMNGGVTSSSSSKGAVAILNLNGKSTASRGSATDPQSLYARKRRERINERLRILQNLVPNGTKVDISTMLEEAVQYVKFLQLQITLLSSDDLWMYSPIAYNGMDIGLLKITSPR